MNRARYAAGARGDIDEISEHIAADNLDAAIRFCLALDDAAQKLAEMPGMGPLRRFAGADKEIRSWPLTGFQNYIVFYKAVPGGILIMRILHGARDAESILAQS